MEGEALYWRRLAKQQARTLQECMQSNTSTEFVGWCAYFDLYEWEFLTKDQAQLALIASEVRRLGILVASIFGGKGDLPPLKDFILKRELPEPPPSNVELDDAEWEPLEEEDKGGIEIGDPLDEKWQKVNDSINSEFAMMAALMGGAAEYKPAGAADGN